MNYTQLSLLLLSTACFNAQAAQHIWFNDSIFQDRFFSLFDLHEDAFDLDQWQDLAISKEDRELLKNARQNLVNVTHTIDQDAKSPKITIKIAGFKALDPKDIKVIEQNKSYSGEVTTKDGKVEFSISRRGFTLSRQVELKRDNTTKANDSKDAKKDEVEKVFHVSSMNSVGEYFKYPVDLTTIKVDSITDTTITLTVEKKRERVLPLPGKTQDQPTKS